MPSENLKKPYFSALSIVFVDDENGIYEEKC
jgi:hypothetical protein